MPAPGLFSTTTLWPSRFPSCVGDGAPDDVVGAAGPDRHDDPDRLVGIALRDGGLGRERRQHGGISEGAASLHRSPPVTLIRSLVVGRTIAALSGSGPVAEPRPAICGVESSRPVCTRPAMTMPVRAESRYRTRSPLAAEIERRRTFAIISHPDAGKTTLTEKLLLFGGAIQLAGQVKAKRNRKTTQSDWMAIEKERGISVVTSVMTFEYGDACLQPARHAGPRGLFRGHLSHADRGRFRGDGDRCREGHRGAHPQAVRSLPAARHPDPHLHQQDGSREPRSVRPAGRDREDAGARHHADELAGRARPRLHRHHRGRERRRAAARRRCRQGRHAARHEHPRGRRAQPQSRCVGDRRRIRAGARGLPAASRCRPSAKAICRRCSSARR